MADCVAFETLYGPPTVPGSQTDVSMRHNVSLSDQNFNDDVWTQNAAVLKHPQKRLFSVDTHTFKNSPDDGFMHTLYY